MPIRRLKRATLAACCAPLLIAVGCSSGDTPGAQPTGRAPQSLISDQLHNGGTQGFLFLPPMVPRPAQMGDFVPTVRPTVRIDEVNAEGVTIRTLATFTTTTGPGRERLRTHIANEPCDSDDDDGDADPEGYFYARWKTNNAHLSTSARYRVRVLVPAAGGGTREIGFADVDVVRTQREFRSVDTVNFTPLLNGHVLRIKFRIDRPAVDGDGDGVFDWVDNCPAQANASQLDSNHDQQGDACECVGVTCVASDVCHAAGVCDPIDGMCSNPDAPSGTACTLPNATALCASGACGVASCNAGHADCNAAATDGCETPTTTLANCGACGVACSLVAHSTPSCGTGTCAITCDAGWADANGDRADGCELDVTTDANCGTPGNACVSGLGDVNTCVGGSCSTIACASDTANCNTAVGDGCEVSLAGDVAHCGACNHACAVANATPSCVASACAVGACHAGFSDCNGLAADGCEVAPASDVANCGACGHACSLPNASPVCAAGLCAVGACAEGFVDLDLDPSNGCEVNLATDVNHCGAVGNHCVMPNGTAACAGGQCVLASCNAGYDNCTTGAGCESDLSAVTSCGGCGVTCASGDHSTATCGAAGCGLTCETGFGDCDGIAANGCEVDLTTDGGHCGACSTACGADTTCQSGVCSAPVCGVGVANCNSLAADGCETPTDANVASCGACGNVCSFTNAVPQCNGGACGFDVCTMGYGDCDGIAANGCEVAFDTLANCGGCGTACSVANGTPVCNAGVCAVSTCAAGFANCDGNAANGCEVNITNSASNCGACGVACTGSNVCQAGVCRPTQGAAWLLNDGCGATTAADSSGNGATGTLSGGPPRALNGSSCHDGGCLFFNGTTDRVTAPYTAAHRFGTGSFSVSVWIRVLPGAVGEDAVVSPAVCGVAQSWLLHLNNGRPSFSTFGTGGAGVRSSATSVADGAWHLLVGRRSSTSVQLLVDGVVVTSAAIASTYDSDANNSVMTIGNLFGCGGREFNGLIDDVRIADHALTDAEVSALNGPHATTPATSTDSANCGGCGVVCAAGAACTGGLCADINECLTDNGGCGANATCTNTLGGRTCACSPGYTGNGFTCTDVNECLTNNGGCVGDATCTNTPGGRTCACSPSSLCGGVCRYLNTDASNCGGCGIVCAGGRICHAAVCVAPPTWTAPLSATAPQALAGRAFHSAIWTGTQMIVWGGQNGNDVALGGTIFGDGAIYTPATNTWTSLPASAPNAPSARFNHTAIWTGSRMIIWGGLGLGPALTSSSPVTVNTGASYDPATDTWTALSAVGAPAARYAHTATWTGAEMIVWGGSTTHVLSPGAIGVTPRSYQGRLNNARYNPATDTWTAMPVDALGSANVERMNHTAVWTGTQLIIWGGHGSCSQLGDGGIYTPATNSWQYLPAGAANAPGPRGQHTALWTGTQMIIWGGGTYPNYGDGAMYNPSSGLWTYMPGTNYGAAYNQLPNEPSYRFQHSAVWTGSRMVVWGGARYCGGCGASALCSDSSHIKGDGGVFDPVTGSWAYVASGAASSGTRVGHTAVWTGTQMIVWGGQRGTSLGDGALLTP